MLRECLQSLTEQETYGGHSLSLEIVVIDNGSTDGSTEMVPKLFPYCHLIRNTTNRGFCGANNQGIAAATSPLAKPPLGWG